MPAGLPHALYPLAIPAEPGTYALFLASSGYTGIQVGRLGRLRTRPGIYVYVGSARGRGGLRARIGHHCRISPKPRWHIDYLRARLAPESIWYTPDPACREHAWACLFGATRGASLPFNGFGASDCRCAAHLFFFERRPGLSGFRHRAAQEFPGHGPILARSLIRPALSDRLSG